jgi:site-specific DNA-methyltransferase (adenine-specific)
MTNQIIKGDCLDILGTLPPQSVDLVVTSPPYNVGLGYDKHDDGGEYYDYLKFSQSWMIALLCLMKPDGRFCLNIPLDKNKGGAESVYADILTAAFRCGWKYKTTIVWNEQNISRRTAWGSWMSASAPYVIAPVEMIAVLYKDTWKKQNKGVSSIGREDFMEWTNGVWTFGGEKKKNVGGHPAAFPEELPRRCIELFSYVDDVVLDPFSGAGTTCAAAKKLKRQYIGIELSEEYHKYSVERLAKIPA